MPSLRFDEKWMGRIKKSLSSNAASHARVIANINDIKTNKISRTAAVLVALCNRNDVASVLYTVRSQTVGTHKGQVCFPGGHINAGESVFEAAHREAHEELGESMGAIQILGPMQQLPAVTGTLVTPVVGYIEVDVGDLTHFSPDMKEVSKIFTRTIEELQSSKSFEVLSNRNGQDVRMPVFSSAESDQDERIWGLTAYITETVLDSIIIPTLENNTVLSQSEGTQDTHLIRIEG
jgi:nudix motif 8